MGGEWATQRLGEVATIVMGQSPPSFTYYNEDGQGVPFYQGGKDFSSRYPRKRVYCTAPTWFAKPGDILFSVRAPIGEINRADEYCSIGHGLTANRGKSKWDTDFIEYVLKSIRQEWRILEGQGAVFGNAKKSDLENLLTIGQSPQGSTYNEEAKACPFSRAAVTLVFDIRQIGSIVLPRLE